eukprot:2566661-Pyramimonas_sp.AAC.1
MAGGSTCWPICAAACTGALCARRAPGRPGAAGAGGARTTQHADHPTPLCNEREARESGELSKNAQPHHDKMRSHLGAIRLQAPPPTRVPLCQ